MKLHVALNSVYCRRLLLLLSAGGFGLLGCYGQADSVGVGSGKAVEDIRREAMVSSTHVITENGEKVPVDSIVKKLNRFYIDQFRHFQDPRAPYFMFMSKDGKLAMGMGGLIRIRGFYDWNGSIPANGFTPYLIPIPKNPESLRRLGSTPAGTGLFFTILGHNSFIGDFMGFIQCDFSGYENRGFKLKKAYLQNDHWTVGYATTTFEDPAAEPPTIDGSGPNGVNSRTNILVRYSKTFRDKWTVAGSVEFPQSSIDADGEYTKACSDYVPDIAAFAQYQWNGGKGHVRLSGLFRMLSYRDLVESRNHNIVGWGAQLSTTFLVSPSCRLFGIASVGQGHESYTTDLACGSFDLVAKPFQRGELYAPTGVGYVLGAQYYFTPKVYSNVALSQQRYYPKGDLKDGQYKYGLYGAVNLFWDITPRLEIGAEYLIGERMNFNKEHESANRVTAMFMFSF